jgi:hypothetical protein
MNSFYGNPSSIEDIPNGIYKCNCTKQCNCAPYRNNIKEYLLHAHQAMTELGSWEKFKTDAPVDGGFMFSSKKWISDISAHPLIDADNHSGSSWATTMRFMEYIGLNGWDSFVIGWTK